MACVAERPKRGSSRSVSQVTDPVLSDGAASYTPSISERRGTATTFLHSGLKNADAQTSAAGSVSGTRVYDAFGAELSSTGSWQGAFGYAGGFGYQEDANGFKLLGHRYYDPSTGRFLTRDPAKDGRNWYTYCTNNPVTCFDNAGLAATLVGGGALVGGGSAAGGGVALIGPGLAIGIAIVGGIAIGLPIGNAIADHMDRTSLKELPASELDRSPAMRAEHTNNRRNSTKNKHQEGRVRADRDKLNKEWLEQLKKLSKKERSRLKKKNLRPPSSDPAFIPPTTDPDMCYIQPDYEWKTAGEW